MPSNRITLIPCDIKTLLIVLEGDDAIRKKLDLNVPEQWTEFGVQAFQYTLKKIEKDPKNIPWWTFLPVVHISNTLIGSCGFKGPPDDNGVVELGYEVATKFRNQGYATEITAKLLDKAFGNEHVRRVQAHTMPEKNASVRVLEKNGFVFDKSVQIAGTEQAWRWSIGRENYSVG